MSASGQALDALGNKQILLPGHGVSAYHSHQFVEEEYMKPEEFDAFLADPSDFAVRTFAPRIFTNLKAFSQLPPLNRLFWGFGESGITELFTTPEFVATMEAIAKAGKEVVKWRTVIGTFNQEMEDLGFPPYAGSMTMAPYDILPDLLRGMKGSMLDMYRRPDKVLEACEKLLPMMIEKAISTAKLSENKRVFIPLHRGAEGFMSLKQFEKFYWPTFKRLLLALIDAGLIPVPFFEGDYTSRLEYLLELPKGKIVANLDTTDIFKAKQIIGQHICLQGNIPASLLQTGDSSGGTGIF